LGTIQVLQRITINGVNKMILIREINNKRGYVGKVYVNNNEFILEVYSMAKRKNEKMKLKMETTWTKFFNVAKYCLQLYK